MTTDIITEARNRKLISDINDYLLVAGSPLLVRVEHLRQEGGEERLIVIATAGGAVEYVTPCSGAEGVAAFLAPLRTFLSVQDTVVQARRLRCKRCGHGWESDLPPDSYPPRCASCGNPNWQTPRPEKSPGRKPKRTTIRKLRQAEKEAEEEG